MTPAELEVARHALVGIAEEMGVALHRSAYSVNVTERLDLSTAVYDAEGRLAAQAAHIPVHLGSMDASVASVREELDLGPGETALVNDPYLGGTHLPDLTAVTRVGDLGYVANRAHHADIGGAAPGSMPADATEIAMEGLRVPPLKVVDAHGLRHDVVALVAANSRDAGERHGDLRAQLAANHVGARRLKELAGRVEVQAAVREVCAYSDRRVRAANQRLPDGSYRAEDVLEWDEPLRIAATVVVSGDEISVDFEGTSPQVPANLNAVLAVTISACRYVHRLVADPAAPANDGAGRSLSVVAPPRSIVHAAHPAPVATGNVETSQRIVDVLLDCFAQALDDRVPAGSQGTMNNVLIGAAPEGGSAWTFYETVGGGEGATPDRPGMSGVHTHMTNTRNTPAEELELALPLRVVRYALRPGSGGPGRHPGGDGIVRELEALADAVLTLQTSRRERPPRGRAGGEDGACGRNLLIHPDDREEELPARTRVPLPRGARLRVETPGGGGWGS